MRISCLQYTAEADYQLTEARVYPLLERAVADGADLIILPECALFLSAHQLISQRAAIDASSPHVRQLQAFAKQHDIYLIIGSVITTTPSGLRNRTLLINRAGHIDATYDKIHLFDVDLPSGEKFRESELFDAGTEPQISHINGWSIGLSICFDVRFPALYRYYATNDVDLVVVPAAFTRVTGEAHWHTLLRSRAIENGLFIAASALCGVTQEGRETYGHSVIYDPWGECVGELDDLPGCLTVDIDRTLVRKIRSQIPVLSQNRIFDKN